MFALFIGKIRVLFQFLVGNDLSSRQRMISADKHMRFCNEKQMEFQVMGF